MLQLDHSGTGTAHHQAFAASADVLLSLRAGLTQLQNDLSIAGVRAFWDARYAPYWQAPAPPPAPDLSWWQSHEIRESGVDLVVDGLDPATSTTELYVRLDELISRSLELCIEPFLNSSGLGGWGSFESDAAQRLLPAPHKRSILLPDPAQAVFVLGPASHTIRLASFTADEDVNDEFNTRVERCFRLADSVDSSAQAFVSWTYQSY